VPPSSRSGSVHRSSRWSSGAVISRSQRETPAHQRLRNYWAR
jgi:hypothetical protein